VRFLVRKTYYISLECPGEVDENTDFDEVRKGEFASAGVSLQGWLGDPLLSITRIYFSTIQLADQLYRRFGIESHPLRVSKDPEYDFFLELYSRIRPEFRRLVLPRFSEQPELGVCDGGVYLLASEDALDFLLKYSDWACLEFGEVPIGRDWLPEDLSLQRPSPRKRQ
jgi:hypothetical protein